MIDRSVAKLQSSMEFRSMHQNRRVHAPGQAGHEWWCMHGLLRERKWQLPSAPARHALVMVVIVLIRTVSNNDLLQGSYPLPTATPVRTRMGFCDFESYVRTAAGRQRQLAPSEQSRDCPLRPHPVLLTPQHMCVQRKARHGGRARASDRSMIRLSFLLWSRWLSRPLVIYFHVKKKYKHKI
jgi:hypothetical protein